MQNNDDCTICGSKEDWNHLLCCDLCPRAFHLYCFKPPLKAIPKGDWFCSECLPLLHLDDVEKFLATRTRKVVSPHRSHQSDLSTFSTT